MNGEIVFITVSINEIGNQIIIELAERGVVVVEEIIS